MLARCDSISPYLILVLNLMPQLLKEAQPDFPLWEAPLWLIAISLLDLQLVQQQNLHNITGQ